MKWVIRYEDQTYESNGWGVPLSEATVWTSREEAERWVENIGQGTVIEHPDPTLQPAPSSWVEGVWPPPRWMPLEAPTAPPKEEP